MTDRELLEAAAKAAGIAELRDTHHKLSAEDTQCSNGYLDELAQANATIAALQAKIEEADGKASAEADWFICSELTDGRLQYTQDNADEEYAMQLFTRPPITAERELALLGVIEQMREAIKICVEFVPDSYEHPLVKEALTPDL